MSRAGHYEYPEMGGMRESLARDYWRRVPAAQPIADRAGVTVATLYGPRGEVLKTVEPPRVPFGFVREDA